MSWAHRFNYQFAIIKKDIVARKLQPFFVYTILLRGNPFFLRRFTRGFMTSFIRVYFGYGVVIFFSLITEMIYNLKRGTNIFSIYVTARSNVKLKSYRILWLEGWWEKSIDSTNIIHNEWHRKWHTVSLIGCGNNKWFLARIFLYG